MFTIGENFANELVRTYSAKADECRRQAKSKALTGPRFAGKREALRNAANQYDILIAGLNTGKGVTRRSALERANQGVTVDA